MACWCPDSQPDVHTKAWGPLDWRKMLSKALMQMWEPRCAHVSRSLAWGTLDQDNTSCLVQGIPALKRTLTWCHWDPCMQRSSEMHYLHLFVWWQSVWVTNCNCFRSVFVSKSNGQSLIRIICKDLLICGSCKLIRNCLLYWYGYFIYSYLLLCIFFV